MKLLVLVVIISFNTANTSFIKVKKKYETIKSKYF